MLCREKLMSLPLDMPEKKSREIDWILAKLCKALVHFDFILRYNQAHFSYNYKVNKNKSDKLNKL